MMEKEELKIITLKELGKVKALLKQCENKDIFSHPDYLKLFEDFEGNIPLYFYYGTNLNFILIPYFKRLIRSPQPNANLDRSQQFYDLISPWYFGGPIHNIKDKALLLELFSNFKKEFEIYCQEQNIVTEFQRLNPLLGNDKLYQKDPGLFYDREVVYLDLTKDLSQLSKEYTRHTRKNINKAKAKELRVYSDYDFKKFTQLYWGSMDRKEARKFYYFNETFFHQLFVTFRDEIKLFHVDYDNKTICSSIELGKGLILHDYLRGTDPNFLLLRPNDIIVDEMIKWAKDAGYKYFVLGGGNSSSPEDGLFRFKKSFSSTTSSFYLYKKIHNLNKYKELCKLKGVDGLRYELADYFPEYAKP